MSETGMRTYELGFVLVPTTPETEVPSQVDILTALIAQVGGTVQSTGTPEFIDLAYQMEKNIASKKMKWSQGYFGWIKFDAAPDAVESLKRALDGNLEVIRYLITKTHVENTVVFKKPKIEAKRASVDEEAVFEEVSEDDTQEDHEKLPDLEADIVEAPKGDKEGEE